MEINNILSSNLGFPRMGENRELKKLVESFWAGNLKENELTIGVKSIRESHWNLQKTNGISLIPSNDFSLYDHVLDHIHLFGAIPNRYQDIEDGVHGLKTYFAMARGYQTSKSASEVSSDKNVCSAFGLASKESDLDKKIDVGSMEMKKWFDTNYHYIVPEFEANQSFKLTSCGQTRFKPVVEYLEAKNLGIETRPVILGPISFLLLGKSSSSNISSNSSKFDSLVHLDSLLVVYCQLLEELSNEGVKWIQIDEPILSLDLEIGDSKSLNEISLAFSKSFQRIHNSIPNVKILLASYFGPIGNNISIVKSLPINAFHIDTIRSSEIETLNLVKELSTIQSLSISLGLIDGRNIWKSNLQEKIELVEKVLKIFKPLNTKTLFIAPSCSLLHSPHSLTREQGKINEKVLDWLAFSNEKLIEVNFLTQFLNSSSLDNDNNDELKLFLNRNKESLLKRSISLLIHNPLVRERIESINDEMLKRKNVFSLRREVQRNRLSTLPKLFPTTTIGSFPQTKEVRLARQQFKSKKITSEEYDQFIKNEIRNCIKIQEDCGLDVLVHGEFERNDMVEFFGENLQGFVFTCNGWVQSFGSRFVKPPIIFGDVSRNSPMTLDYTLYAQSQTKKPVKGMLTGPVTILQWSFVRNDIPRSETCNQIALAIRDEVSDLEAANIACIQIDEPAIREGLPLRHSDWSNYLKWSVDSFLLCSSGVRDDTQIHSHMCYSDFNDIFEAIQRMDTDVLTIENSKSDLKLLKAFELYSYNNEIGPGLYDIHSPRIPSIQDMKYRVEQMLKYLSTELLWVNPDCGLKTRSWPETILALKNMVQVSIQLRKIY